MTWIVELSLISGDEEVMRVALAENGYEISGDPEASAALWLLRHPKYEQFKSAMEVRQDTESAISRLTQMAQLEGIDIGACVGTVRRVNTDGSITKHMFAALSTRITLEARAHMSMVRNSNITEEDRLRRSAEAARLEAEKKRASSVARISAAVRDPTVILISQLVRTPTLTMTEAGHIVDIVFDALKSDMSAFTTKSELTRFQRSINHPEVMGLSARHAITNVDPPPTPMTENEARSFAKRIGLAWLRLYERNT